MPAKVTNLIRKEVFMSDMLLEGSVEKNNIRYKWVTEPNACPKCQEMEGRLFNSIEEFEAARPHPHCKCSYEKIPVNLEEEDKNIVETAFTKAQEEKNELTEEQISKPSEETEKLIEEQPLKPLEKAEEISATQNSEIQENNKPDPDLEEYKKEQQTLRTAKLNEVELNSQLIKLEKDAIEQQEKLESALISLKMAKEFVREKIAKLDKDMKLFIQELYDLTQKIESTINRIIHIKRSLKNFCELPTQLKYDKTLTLEEKEEKLKLLQTDLDTLIQASSIIFQEASSLWKLSTLKFNDNLDYIENNGKLLNSFIDIEEPSIRTAVKEKLESQGMSLKSRGVRFSYDSSLASAIIHSQTLKNFINNNKYKFKPNTMLPKDYLEFTKEADPDLYFGINKCTMINIYIDFNERFTAKIIDTYDFNNNENKVLVEQANTLQREGKIETYFIIVDIVIPKDIWENY